MFRREILAFGFLLLVALVFPASLFAYQAYATNPPGVRVITLAGNAPGSGGWQPNTIRVNLGERVRLRIVANNVVHGFAVPELGLNVQEILPGHVAEVEFTASKVGRFPFSCTRWCSVDHWRMRGNIEVVDPANPGAGLVTPGPMPLFQQLKIDIDSMPQAKSIPSRQPSAALGALLGLSIPAELQSTGYLRTHSPSDVWGQLRADPAFRSYSDDQLWDAVAWLWKKTAGDESIARGGALYKQDCAACHGETGKGDGPAGINLPGLTTMHPDMKRGPADFTNLSQMLGASDALLQGKILRGGMGTGMPEWKSLYSEQQMWDLVAFIRSFSFDYSSAK